MKPFFKYYGSRWRLAELYGPPKRPVVVEPFAGGAGYSVYHNVEKAILVEKDPVIAGIWKYLIEKASVSEILALNEEAESRADLQGAAEPLKDLAGLWFSRGDTQPRDKLTEKNRHGRDYGTAMFWSREVKRRIIDALPLIRNWIVIEGDYTTAPDIECHYFVDAPFQHQGARYGANDLDYNALADWCLKKDVLTVCEAEPADWLPFKKLRRAKNQTGKIYTELVFERNKYPGQLIYKDEYDAST